MGKTSSVHYTIPYFGRAFSLSTQALLGLIVVVATVLRLGSAIYQGNTVADLPGIYDQISYDGLARRLIGGYGFSFAEGHWPATRAGEPTAHWSYLYTLYLAGVYLLFGAQPVVARIIQAVLAGILHPWLAWRVGRRVFGPRIGLIAAGLNAVYIYFFYYAGGLITETFFILGILWTLDVALRLAEAATRPAEENGTQGIRWRLWLELGLASGMTVLLRQVILLFVPFLFAWLWWVISAPHRALPGRRPWLGRLLPWRVLVGLAGATCVILALIIPWTIRNYRAFGTFVLLNTNAGFAFFWGNHPIYGTHYVSLLPDGAMGYYNLIPKELLPLNEAALDSALLKIGMGYVKDDPVRILLLSFGRALEYFKFWPSPQSGLINNISRVGSFGLCLPFMLYGLWVSVRLFRVPERREQRPAIILLYLFVIIFPGIHLLSWALIRYRLPVDAVLLFFAALGLEQLARSIPLFLKAEIAHN